MEEYFLHPDRAIENVEGSFYTVSVGTDCGCMIPEEIAPTLLKCTDDRRYQTYFSKQPETVQEIMNAINAINTCPIHNIRYGGKDPKIIKDIEVGQSDYIIDINGQVVLAEDNA